MVTETHQQAILQLGRRREPQPRPGFMTRKMASAGLRSWGEAAAAAKNRTNWKKAGRVCCGDATWHTSFSKINNNNKNCQ